MLVASIPSPSSGIVNIGPLHIHLYGLTLLVAILACVWLTSRRWKAMGGDPDLVVRVAVWGEVDPQGAVLARARAMRLRLPPPREERFASRAMTGRISNPPRPQRSTTGAIFLN